MESVIRKARDADATREKLLEAALQSFSTRGFDASSTRQIEELAGVNRGLITYHFGSKPDLWLAAVGRYMDTAAEELQQEMDALTNIDGIARPRYFVRAYVRFCARHPELNRLMIQEGMRDEDRLAWLVKHHVAPWYKQVSRIFQEARSAGIAPDMAPLNFYYILTGAATLIFSNTAEASKLSSEDPRSEKQVTAHAEALANILFPEKNL